jgi:hypothetical protein
MAGCPAAATAGGLIATSSVIIADHRAAHRRAEALRSNGPASEFYRCMAQIDAKAKAINVISDCEYELRMARMPMNDATMRQCEDYHIRRGR